MLLIGLMYDFIPVMETLLRYDWAQMGRRCIFAIIIPWMKTPIHLPLATNLLNSLLPEVRLIPIHTHTVYSTVY
jgi:hypothetical protein